MLAPSGSPSPVSEKLIVPAFQKVSPASRHKQHVTAGTPYSGQNAVSVTYGRKASGRSSRTPGHTLGVPILAHGLMRDWWSKPCLSLRGCAQAR